MDSFSINFEDIQIDSIDNGNLIDEISEINEINENSSTNQKPLTDLFIDKWFNDQIFRDNFLDTIIDQLLKPFGNENKIKNLNLNLFNQNLDEKSILNLIINLKSDILDNLIILIYVINKFNNSKPSIKINNSSNITIENSQIQSRTIHYVYSDYQKIDTINLDSKTFRINPIYGYVSIGSFALAFPTESHINTFRRFNEILNKILNDKINYFQILLNVFYRLSRSSLEILELWNNDIERKNFKLFQKLKELEMNIVKKEIEEKRIDNVLSKKIDFEKEISKKINYLKYLESEIQIKESELNSAFRNFKSFEIFNDIESNIPLSIERYNKAIEIEKKYQLYQSHCDLVDKYRIVYDRFNSLKNKLNETFRSHIEKNDIEISNLKNKLEKEYEDKILSNNQKTSDLGKKLEDDYRKRIAQKEKELELIAKEEKEKLAKKENELELFVKEEKEKLAKKEKELEKNQIDCENTLARYKDLEKEFDYKLNNIDQFITTELQKELLREINKFKEFNKTNWGRDAEFKIISTVLKTVKNKSNLIKLGTDLALIEFRDLNEILKCMQIFNMFCACYSEKSDLADKFKHEFVCKINDYLEMAVKTKKL